MSQSENEDLTLWASADAPYPSESVLDVLECEGKLCCASIISVEMNAEGCYAFVAFGNEWGGNGAVCES